MEVKKIARFTGHQGGIYKISGGTEKSKILTYGGDGRIVEWDLDGLGDGVLRAKSDYKFFSGFYDRDSGSCYAGDMNGSVYRLIFHKETDNIQAWKPHSKGVFDIVKASSKLYSAGGDGTITKWSDGPFFPEETRKVSDERMRTLLYDAERKLMLAGSSDGCIYLLDPESLKTVDRVDRAHESTVFSMVFSGHGLLVTGGRDAQLNFWSYPDLKLLHRIPAHLFTVNDLAISPCGNWLASAGRDKEVRIWDLKTYRLVKVIDRLKDGGHINSVNAVYWDRQSEFLCTAGDDRTLMLWEVTP